jgi:serine/threonine protein kinase
MWSVGIILHVILVGYPPFMEPDQKTLFQKIRIGNFVFHEEDWRDITPDAQNLIRSLLVVAPSKRVSATQALRCDWINEVEDGDLSSTDLSSSVCEMERNESNIKLNTAVTALRIAAAFEEERESPPQDSSEPLEAGTP